MQIMSGPWTIPLNPEKGNIFECITCGILVLKPIGQYESTAKRKVHSSKCPLLKKWRNFTLET